jgi:hypothetical protein
MTYIVPLVVTGTIAALLLLVIRLSQRVRRMQVAGKEIAQCANAICKYEGNEAIGLQCGRIDFLLSRYFDVSLFSKPGSRTHELLYFIIQKLDIIMDQNKTIQDALDALDTEIQEIIAELEAHAGDAKPGMTDEQAQALANRIAATAARLKGAEIPKAPQA